jgi:hypothetical protein
MVRRGSVWCGVAQSWCGVAQYGAAWLTNGAAWLSMVRRGSLWCGVAQLAERRLAVRQARVRFSARHHREAFPTEHTSDEEMERGFSEWRRMNVLWLNECMYVIKSKNKQKEWHSATKPLVFKCIRRMRGKNLCIRGEDGKRILAYSPNTPKDIKVCISRLIIILWRDLTKVISILN